MYCTHEDCREFTRDELLYMAKILPEKEELRKAADNVMHLTVRCRHVPRNSHGGAPQAPLPGAQR